MLMLIYLAKHLKTTLKQARQTEGMRIIQRMQSRYSHHKYSLELKRL